MAGMTVRATTRTDGANKSEAAAFAALARLLGRSAAAEWQMGAEAAATQPHVDTQKQLERRREDG